jgi:hypothetical protein
VTSRRNRVAATAASLGCLLTVLAGCSGNDAKTDSAPPPAPAPAPSATGVISPPTLTSVPDLKKPAGILKDTTMGDCAATKGPVKASGTVTNSGKDGQDLVVVVSWIVPQGSDVVARGVAVIKNAAAGSKHDWAVSSTVKVDQQVQCVLSARRGSISKA